MTTMTKTVGPVIKTKLPGPNAARIVKEDAIRSRLLDVETAREFVDVIVSNL